MNYQEAIHSIRDHSVGSVPDVIDAIAWGLARAVDGNDAEPAHYTREAASKVYETLNAAGFRVIKG